MYILNIEWKLIQTKFQSLKRNSSTHAVRIDSIHQCYANKARATKKSKPPLIIPTVLEYTIHLVSTPLRHGSLKSMFTKPYKFNA